MTHHPPTSTLFPYPTLSRPPPPPRRGGNPPRHMFRVLEPYVAHQPVALFRRWIRHAIHAHVDHYCSRLDPLTGHELGLPDGHDQNVRQPRDRLHVPGAGVTRSEEHTSELQSQSNLVCRLLLE